MLALPFRVAAFDLIGALSNTEHFFVVFHGNEAAELQGLTSKNLSGVARRASKVPLSASAMEFLISMFGWLLGALGR